MHALAWLIPEFSARWCFVFAFLCHLALRGHRLRCGCSTGCRRCAGSVPALPALPLPRSFRNGFHIWTTGKELVVLPRWILDKADGSNAAKQLEKAGLAFLFYVTLHGAAGGNVKRPCMHMCNMCDCNEAHAITRAEARAMPDSLADAAIREHRHAESRMPGRGYFVATAVADVPDEALRSLSETRRPPR